MHVSNNSMADRSSSSRGAAAAARGQKFDAAVMRKKEVRFYLFAAFVIELAFLFGMLGLVTGAPAEDVIPSLPGQPQVTFKQYGGYVTVDAERGRALYYYFVEAEADADTKPLVLWLNGGPGCSSLGGGAFTLLGPFYTNGVGGSGSLSRNFNAWNRVSNVLFLESPAGVGFSYSNTTSDYVIVNDDTTAADSLAFLLGWFEKYPEYRGRDFFITGQSYAGHYVPQLAAAVMEKNAQPGQPRIELKGVMVGNPAFDYIDFFRSPYQFLWSHGVLSETTYNELIVNCRLDGSNESEACQAAQIEAYYESDGVSAFLRNGSVDRYNLLTDVCRQNGNQSLGSNQVSPCIEKQRDIYLNMPEVQLALHARTTNWSTCFEVVQANYNTSDVFLRPILPVLKDLVRGGLRLWVYSGDQDAAVPLIGTRQIVGQAANELQLISTRPYRPWFEGQQVAGWTTSWGNLTYATVKNAGHNTPRDEPARALQLVTSFLSGTPLPSTFTA